MAELQHKQIQRRLTERFVPQVDVADLGHLKQEDRDRQALSRCIAVAALKALADVSDENACKSLVDGSNDNGIDLIYYDVGTKTLFLIQSKWNDSHGGSVDSAAILKFLQGVKDLVSSKKEKFNTKVQVRWATIIDALDKLDSVSLVIAYPGSGSISADIRDRINEFVESQNDTSELFFSKIFAQKEFFQYLAKEAAPSQIDLQLRLTHYGTVDNPLKAVYGQVSASDVARWYADHGNNLFSGNIRHFLGEKSEVNGVISETLLNNQDYFWYFNNGITLITEKLTRQPVGSADKSVGVFDCKSVSIVNGAQTVGTIGRAIKENDSLAFLQARVIEVTDPNSPIGRNITRASNTQNKIDARNFVALDPEQERIRTELLIDGISYEFREGEPIESGGEGFEFIEGITALACAQNDISLVALAKRYIGGLYADIASAPYKTLFNSGTSSDRLWNAVRLVRRVERALKASYNPLVPRERDIAVHGNRFLVHCVLRYLGCCDAHIPEKEISDESVLRAVISRLNAVKLAFDDQYAESYAAPLFKNVTKCTNIRQIIENPRAPTDAELLG